MVFVGLFFAGEPFFLGMIKIKTKERTCLKVLDGKTVKTSRARPLLYVASCASDDAEP
jgi:hypothetical protein